MFPTRWIVAVACARAVFATVPAFSLEANEAFITTGSNLVRIDLLTGFTETVGVSHGADQMSGLTFDPLTGVLYAVDHDNLLILSTVNGVVRWMRPHGIGPLLENSGLTADRLGNLYLVTGGTTYVLNKNTGHAVPLGSNSLQNASAAAFSPNDELYAIGEIPSLDKPQSLVRLDPVTGELMQFIGELHDPIRPLWQVNFLGMDFDSKGRLYVIENVHSHLYRASTVDASLTRVGNGFGSGLAIFRLFPGDCDADGFITSEDLVAFAACAAGPDVPVTPECDCADADGDGDADLEDYEVVQGLLHACNLYTLDCNTNGLSDECDLSLSRSQDCNTNGTPDECDVPGGASGDCDSNALPDECSGTRIVFADDFSEGEIDPIDWPAIYYANGGPQGLGLQPNGFVESRFIDLSWAPSADLTYSWRTPFLDNGTDLIAEYWNGATWQVLTSYTATPVQTPWMVEVLSIPPNGLIRRFKLRFSVTDAEGQSWRIADLSLAVHVADCNLNAFPDACELTAGGSTDCNSNGVPDECDADCNTNGNPDDCDIVAATSLDCNADGRPDECEPDCNGNGIADQCDLAGGTSTDCDSNGIPDDCDVDCNTNGVADSCDLRDGASPDCNGNSIPDECDVTQGSSADCNTNGVPDECQPGCAELIETVAIGDPGNASNATFGGPYGAVAYDYAIGRFEVTNAQYVVFLNAVVRSDPQALFDTGMQLSPLGGLTRSGTSGSYMYALKPHFGNKPVGFVTWLDAARYCNWLHNGRPSGAQDASTTEDGAYDLSISNPQVNAVRKAGALWYLPTQDEWYKAAYYDPVSPGADGSTTADYWLYPTMSDTAPTVALATPQGDIANPGVNVVNYGNYTTGCVWNGENNNVTTVGGCGPLSIAHYGSYDQAGNAQEWTESIQNTTERIASGGSSAYGVTPGYFDSNDSARGMHPNSFYGQLGFRVAKAP